MKSLLLTAIRASTLSLTVMIGFLLGGCSGFFIGKENLSEPIDLPNNPNLVRIDKDWQRSVGDGNAEKSLALRPLIVGGQIYAVDAHGELSAFARDSGEKVWRVQTHNRIAAGVAGNDSILLIASENGALLAYATEDGQFLWRYQTSSEILATPLVIKNLVVARAIDGQITALDSQTGAERWKTDVLVAELSVRGNAQPLALGDMLVVTDSSGRLNVFSLQDGRRILSTPLGFVKGKTTVERISDIVATPTVSDNLFYASIYLQKTLAIDLRGGRPAWETADYSVNDLFVDQQALYLVDKNSLITAVNKNTGARLWQSGVLEGHRISPLSGDGDWLLTITDSGLLCILNAKTGDLLSYTAVGSEKAFVAPQYTDGRWLTYTADGKLSLFSLKTP